MQVNRIHILLIFTLALVSCSQLKKKTEEKESLFFDPYKNFGFLTKDENERIKVAEKKGEDAKTFLENDLVLKANDFSFKGESKEAINYYKLVLNLKPNDIYIQQKLSLEMMKIGDLVSAEKILENLFYNSENNDDSSGIVLAGLYNALMKPEKAKEVYLKIIQSKNELDIEEACLYLAKQYVEDKLISDAQSLLSNCQAKVKDNPVFTYYKGKIENDLNQKEKALHFFKEAIKIDPSYSEAQLALGIYYEEKKQLDKALIVYENYVTKNPDDQNHSLLSRFVDLLFLQRKYDKALPYALKLLSLDNSNLNLKVKLAMLYADREKFDEASNLLKDVIALAPESDKVLFYYATLKQQMGDFVVAIEFYKKVPSTSEHYNDSLIQISQLLGTMAKDEKNKLTNLDQAYNEFHKFINEESAKNPNIFSDLKMAEAQYFDGIGDTDLAIEKMEETRLHTSFKDSHKYYYASLLEKSNRVKESRELIYSILKNNPKSPEALNFLAYSYLEKNESMDQAYRYLKDAILLKPNDGYIRDSMAWYFYKVKSYKNALKESLKAIELAERDAIITKHLGLIYLELKQHEKAIHFLNKSITLSMPDEDKKDVLQLIENLNQKRLPASLP